MIQEISILDIPGFAIGQAEDPENGTGCTVILCEHGAIGGVDVRGGGPATRDTDLLDPRNTVQEVNGVVLSGGSALGLEAATGVMKWLSEKGVGFDVGGLKVPIVVQADIFDLAVGKPVWPDVDMGYAAAKNSEQHIFQSGNHGAGTGASVGKMLGNDKAMKSGIGAWACQAGELKVGAIAAVNACADVFEEETGRQLAGIYDKERGILKTEELILQFAGMPANLTGVNTTVSCILTNAKLDKAQMNKLASMCHDAYARSIRPCHLATDGDTIFTLSSEETDSDLNMVAVIACKALSRAIENAVKSADPAYGLESWKSVHSSE